MMESYTKIQEHAFASSISTHDEKTFFTRAKSLKKFSLFVLSRWFSFLLISSRLFSFFLINST